MAALGGDPPARVAIHLAALLLLKDLFVHTELVLVTGGTLIIFARLLAHRRVPLRSLLPYRVDSR